MKDSAQTPLQIKWEHLMLRKADAIMFWFCEETLCPITLYELGTWTQKSIQSGTKLFIGCHPNYPRINDVKIQTDLEIRSSVKVVTSLPEIAEQIEIWYNSIK